MDTFGSLLIHHMKRGTGLPHGKVWTLERLSDKCCVSRDTISLWRRNKATPQEGNYLALLRAFGLSDTSDPCQRVIMDEFDRLKVQIDGGNEGGSSASCYE